MKYILQMVVDESGWERLSPAQMQPMIDAMESYNDELRAGGAWVLGEGLDFSKNAKTLRLNDGQATVEAGPAINNKEQLGGFWIIEAMDIDEAIAWAKRVPMKNGAIEVRALVPDDSRENQPVAAGSASSQRS